MFIQKLIYSIWIFLIGVILSSCSATHPLPAIFPTPTYTPRFVTVDCAGTGSARNSYQVICGYLLVTEDGLNPDSQYPNWGWTWLKLCAKAPKRDPIMRQGLL